MQVSPDHRLPAEFEPHAATWIAWPCRPDNWRSDAYYAQRDTIALACLIAAFEPVRLAAPADRVATLRNRLPDVVQVVAIEYDDTWVRDTGPSVLVSPNSPPVAIDWRFNSWGGLFSGTSKDDAVAGAIAKFEGIESKRAPIVLEGGALICNGVGTGIVTEESVLASNRNPGLSRADVEDVFRRLLNLQKIIWIPHGLANDESGGHIDNLCAFASSSTVIAATTDDTSHPSFHRLKELHQVLRTSAANGNRSLSILELPLPDPTSITPQEAAGFADADGAIVRTVGTPLAPSHLNFTLVNGGVIVPTFNGRSDSIALDVIASAYPDRRVVPFDCREFVLGGGGVHCLTKEIPHRSG